jgi:cobalamin-dependent methionine synthase I
MKTVRRIRTSVVLRFANGPTEFLTEQLDFPPEDIVFDPNIFR